MMSNCPNCNFELDKVYKYCPNCGENLIGNKPKDVIEKEFIICDNCGEEANANLPYCSECGVKLSGKEKKLTKVIEKQVPVQKKEIKPVVVEKKSTAPKQNIPPGKRAAHVPKSEQKSNKVEVSKPTLIIIAAAVIAVVILVLSLAGVFDNKSEDVQVQNQMGNIPNLNVQADITALEQQYKNNPENHQILLAIANMAHDAKLYPKAIETYKQYIAREPKDVDAIVDLGICYYETGDINMAIQTMELGAKTDARHQKAHFNLGIVNMQAGNIEKAKEWFNKAVNIAPNTETGKSALQQLNTLNNQ